MKVYAVIGHWNYEGHDRPSRVFLNEEAARAYALELKAGCKSRSYSVAVEDYEVDETIPEEKP
jgi:hypothetical protein